MGKYYKTDKEEMQKRRAEIGSGKFWEPREGKNQIRILPPWSKKGVWFFKLPLHYGLKDSEDRNRAYPCFREWKNEKCPCCDAIAELKKVEGGGKVAEKMRAKSKYYVNLIDRRIGEDKIFIYGFSGRSLNEILSYEDDEDYGDIVDPEEGYDFIVEKTGSGLKTKYAIRIRPKPSAAGDFGDLYDLEVEVPNEISQRELADMIQKQYGELLTDFNPDDYGKKKKKVDDDDPPKKRKGDDDDDPPKKKKKVEDDDDDPPKKKKRVVDDDDDPPKKKTRKVEED